MPSQPSILDYFKRRDPNPNINEASTSKVQSLINTDKKSSKRVQKRKQYDSNDESSSGEASTKKSKTSNPELNVSSTIDENDVVHLQEPNITNIEELHDNTTFEKKFYHESLEFLQSSHILDGNRNRPDNPDYDHKSLYVPESFLKQCTPAMRQWWSIKKDHFDCILLFKVGKFYECYHMDAVIIVKVLGISFSRSNFAHTGFPEQAYMKMKDIMINNGLKFARIEQTETPEMKAERRLKMGLDKKAKKVDNVVTREICEIASSGACINNFISSDRVSCFSSHIIAMKEILDDKQISFGICICDVNLSEFHFTYFLDDKFRSNLLTVFAHYKPSMFVLEKRCLSKITKNLLDDRFNVRQEWLLPKTEFFQLNKTEEQLRNINYFKTIPKFFEDMKKIHTHSQYDMIMQAFGATIYYLQYCLIDVQVLSNAKFDMFDPKKPITSKQKYLIVDSNTIEGLNLFGNEFSLQSKIDYCKSAFGKRLLRARIAKPFLNEEDLKKHLSAIRELESVFKKNPNFYNWDKKYFSKFIDFSKLKQKITTYALRRNNFNHPDHRAIFFEDKIYSKNQIKLLLNFLKGLRLAFELLTKLSEYSFESEILSSFCFEPIGKLPQIEQDLEFFNNAFDHNESLLSGRILPDEKSNKAYSDALEFKNNLESCIEKNMSQIQSQVCKAANLSRSDKGIFVQIPNTIDRSKIPVTFHLRGCTRKQMKYSTNKFDDLHKQILNCEKKISDIIKNFERDITNEFISRIDKWEKVTDVLSSLDLFFSFLKFKHENEEFTTTPIIHTSELNYLKIIGSLPPTSDYYTFENNDIKMGIKDNLGNNKPSLILICGPNMSGKSTILRQTGSNVILAQSGGFPTANKCELSVVDRIFTRIGARDDIVGGSSTFMLELNEMKTIIEHSSKSSLLLIDEFGNGTSSHDGVALAIACINYLKKVECRCFFSTHFQQVMNYFKNDPKVAIKRMSYKVEEKNMERKCEKITFLYKLESGDIKKSYAFNVADMVGIDETYMKIAFDKHEQLMKIQQNITFFKNFIKI